MRKLLLSIFILLFISAVACQQAVKKETAPADVMGKAETAVPQAGTTGNAAVDAVGNDLNTVNAEEKDLGTEDLSDLDSGLSDVQNI